MEMYLFLFAWLLLVSAMHYTNTKIVPKLLERLDKAKKVCNIGKQ